MTEPTMPAKRRWMQVSLRTVLVAVSLLCVILSVWVVPAERQRRTVAAIMDLDGSVEYAQAGQSASESFPMTFLRRWLPPDYLDHVTYVSLSSTAVTDAQRLHLQTLTGLEMLGVEYATSTARAFRMLAWPSYGD